jgi:hypothetical protein
MNNLKENIYNDLGIIQLRDNLKNLNIEISKIDTEILQLAQKKSYLQSCVSSINNELKKSELNQNYK